MFKKMIIIISLMFFFSFSKNLMSDFDLSKCFRLDKKNDIKIELMKYMIGKDQYQVNGIRIGIKNYSDFVLGSVEFDVYFYDPNRKYIGSFSVKVNKTIKPAHKNNCDFLVGYGYGELYKNFYYENPIKSKFSVIRKKHYTEIKNINISIDEKMTRNHLKEKLLVFLDNYEDLKMVNKTYNDVIKPFFNLPGYEKESKELMRKKENEERKRNKNIKEALNKFEDRWWEFSLYMSIHDIKSLNKRFIDITEHEDKFTEYDFRSWNLDFLDFIHNVEVNIDSYKEFKDSVTYWDINVWNEGKTIKIYYGRNNFENRRHRFTFKLINGEYYLWEYIYD